MGAKTGLFGRLATRLRRHALPEAQQIWQPAGAGSAIPDRMFHLGVAGETFANPDGTSRQRIIKQCRAGEFVVLVCEPANPYDYLAVAVRRRATGERIGYLPRGHGMTRQVEQDRVTAEIAELTGGTWYGATIWMGTARQSG